MLWLLMWTIYGLFVGFIAKLIWQGPEPGGFLSTITVGIAGSYMGGFVNFLIGRGNPFQPSGILMGILGGIACLFVYNKFKLNQHMEMQVLKDEIKALKTEKDDEE